MKTKILEEISDVLGEYVDGKTFEAIFKLKDQDGKITPRTRNELLIKIIKYLHNKEQE